MPRRSKQLPPTHGLRKPRPSTVTVPKHVGPHVKLLFSEMRRQNITYDRVEERSGVLRATLKAWRHRNNPTLTSAEAALAVVGYEFVPIPTERALPPEIVAELRPIADRLGLEMPEAVRYAAEIAYREKHMRNLQSPT